MVKLQFLNKYIEERLIKEHAEEEAKHTPSGKLSASILGHPLQWQVLKVIGVPQDEKGEYVIRKFKRGDHVEEWLAGYMAGLINRQKYVEYRNTVGWVDAIVDMRDWKLDIDAIPHEIKSVSNAKFKRIQKSGPDQQHILQACFYGIALGTEKFAIDYVATDDYRVESYLFDTKEHSQEVEEIISRFEEALASKMVPQFVPLLGWHEMDEYNPYKLFKNMGPIEIDAVLQEKYPEAYKKLKGGEEVENV